MVPVQVNTAFDASAIQFSIQAGVPSNWKNALLINAQYHTDEKTKTVSIAWVNENGLATKLVKGDILGYVELENYGNPLQFTDDPVPALAYNANLEEFAISSPTRVLNTGMEVLDKISVYPNPTENILYFDGPSDSYHYRILSIVGKQISNGVLGQNGKIDVQSLPKGEYILRLNGLKKNYSIIFIKK